ncbi:hypothetical protein PV328_005743 [Microctonus aethiopoides]|uniref:Transcription factor TFIIIC triple barrel domain-containing protein n=1 Tax=Microctonus aethiopoides TaxID=144406 RepID=A0AA39FN37_9HYME|nr:hypothetical protein PV328_005743 [Microctonus aethiopoides]
MINDDSPLGDDEEDIFIYVDFEATTSSSIFCNEKLELDMIGLDSEHPIMQVNGKYYEGTYEDAVGTYMFFDKNTEPVIEDEVFDKTPSLKYYNKSKKVLKMKRVFVKPRLEVLGDSNHPQSIPNLETIKAAGVPPNYQKEALLFWEEMRTERLEALNEYLEKQRQREEKRQQGIELESDSDEDNPFAMYKPTAQKLADNTLQTNKNNDKDGENCLNKQSNTLKILDPGPSTSKENVAWSDFIGNPRNIKKYESPIQRKNQGYIEIVKTRSRRQRKNPRKKRNEKVNDIATSKSVLNDGLQNCTLNNEKNKTNDESPADEIVSKVDDELHTMTITDEIIDTIDVSTDDVNYGIENMELEDSQLVIDDDSSENSEKIIPNTEMVDKKVEKQKKREAKMLEISQRLKKIASDINTNT